MNFPLRPFSSNLTTPVTIAKRVSSLPRPTLLPGLNFGPRWRTRISPPLTSCPPKRFTPKRCALESRPLRELPTPFLCAMTLHLDLRDTDRGHDLPVPAVPAIILPPLELDDEDLGALLLDDHLAGDLRRLERLRLHRDLAVLVHQEHLLELDRLTLGLAE